MFCFRFVSYQYSGWLFFFLVLACAHFASMQIPTTFTTIAITFSPRINLVNFITELNWRNKMCTQLLPHRCCAWKNSLANSLLAMLIFNFHKIAATHIKYHVEYNVIPSENHSNHHCCHIHSCVEQHLQFYPHAFHMHWHYHNRYVIF